MQSENNDQSPASSETVSTFRRPLLKAIAGAGALGALGIPRIAQSARAAITGVEIDYKRCKVAFATNASAIDTIAVYYADRNGDRNARYDIAPTVTDPRGYEPLVVEYDPDEDRTQIQLAEPHGSLVCIVAEAGGERTVATNPNEVCVPAGFNTAPSASLTAETADTPPTDEGITVDVGEAVTFVSTATDPDDPERLSISWDLDGDGTYETTGGTATATYSDAGDVDVSLRVVDDCGATDTARLTVTVVPLAPTIEGFPEEQVATVFSDDLEDDSNFGRAVSLDGDSALVGTNSDEKVDNGGAAYVLSRDGAGGWTTDAKLFPDNPVQADAFGGAVSLDGDTALVGAFNKRNPPVDGVVQPNGAAFVFVEEGGEWAQQAKLYNPDYSNNSRQGAAVSLDGDTAVVGAYDASSVVVYTRDGGGVWSEQAVLSGPSASSFGRSVSLEGDTLVVGAEDDDEAGDFAGATFVYTRSGTTWTRRTKLFGEDTSAGDQFGRSVSLDGDSVLVGAYRESEAESVAGAAYVFTGSGGDWRQQAKLLADDADATDQFGWSVGLDGDVALVNARTWDEGFRRDAGAVYVYTRSGTTWAQRALLRDPTPQFGGVFGEALSLDGDRALVGHRREDEQGTAEGAVYEFAPADD